MLKKLLTATLISATLSVPIFADPNNINTENLVMDDMGTFLIKKLNLSEEEAKLSANKLYKKGYSIFMQKVKLANGTKIEFPESSNQRKAMKYLIAAGMLGHPKAAVEAMAWLNFDPFLQGSKQYRYALAEQLHKQGYLYGTYTLGLGYANGNGIAKNRDLALYYLGVLTYSPRLKAGDSDFLVL